MRVEKEYRQFEDITEIRIFDAKAQDFYNPSPKEFDIEDMPLEGLMNSLPNEIHCLIPYESGEDFIIQMIGKFTLYNYNCTQEDVKGRLFSKLAPVFYETLYEEFMEVYKTRKQKNVRFAYYHNNKLTKLSNATIVCDDGKIFLTSNNIDAKTIGHADGETRNFNESKNDILENFSQSGSYYNINGKYTWSQGIYNIINRAKKESDNYYNIVFDLVIPEDQHIVNEIFEIENEQTDHFEEVLRIKTEDGIPKTLVVSISSYFDDNGFIIHQGFVNDASQYSDDIGNPVDFTLDGFKNSTKLALLIEPLSSKKYNFSKGFYYLIEKDYEEYVHSKEILENIVEKDIAEEICKMIDGKQDKIDATITYNVDGNPDNQKVVGLFIESFEYGNSMHSLGFLTDITEERNKQKELSKSNDERLILIKEIQHRIKNNLQIIDSFLNLEKRVYRDDADIIIEHVQTRLTSMALLYENAYNSQDFRNINLKEFLDEYDKQTTKRFISDTSLKLESIADEDLNLTLEVITPLLLIIDEITMNIIKYAFAENAPDHNITKLARKIDDATAELTVEYTGDGIEEMSKTLSCDIIKSLTGQIDGNITLTRQDGRSSYKLVFPIEMEHTIEY